LHLQVDSPGRDGAIARLQLEPMANGLERDLGEVRLDVPEVRVAGSVVFDDGTPCRTATLVIEEPGRERAIRGAESPWRVHWQDADFSVRGDADGGPLRLHVRSEEAVRPADPVAVTPPVRGLRVVLQRAGALVATVRAEGLVQNWIEVYLRTPSGERIECRRGWEPTGEPHRFRRFFGGLPPGTYDVCHCLRTDPAREFRVPDVVVRAGATTDDPRVRDLTVAARSLRLEMVDATTGARVAGRVAVTIQPANGGRAVAVTGIDGLVNCVVRDEPDAVCWAPEHEPTHVRLRGEGLTVRMLRSTVPLTLRLAPPQQAMPATAKLRVLLEPELTGPERSPLCAPDGAGSMAEFLGKLPCLHDLAPGVPLALDLVRGRYRLVLTLRSATGSVDVGAVTPMAFDLHAEADIELRASSQAWGRALARLGAK